MHNKRTMLVVLAVALLLVGLVACTWGVKKFESQGIRYGEYGNMHINGQVLAEGEQLIRNDVQVAAPTTIATATPALVVDSKGVSVILEVRDAATPVWAVRNGGAVAESGPFVLSSNMVQTGPTAATTATPVIYANTAADAPDLLVLAKDGSAVFKVGNDGSVTYTTSTVCQTCIKITGATAALTATPAFMIDNAADVNDLFVVMKDTAAVFTIGNAGAITRAGADTLTGSLIQTGHIINVGPTAATTATPVLYSNNAADVNDALVIAKDGTAVLKVGNAGGLVLSGKLQPACTYTEVVANANSSVTVASSCYVYAVATSVNADITLATTSAVTGTLLSITQIGAGTLVITDTNLISHDGAALSLGANDNALLIFDGAKWNALLEIAGS